MCIDDRTVRSRSRSLRQGRRTSSPCMSKRSPHPPVAASHPRARQEGGVTLNPGTPQFSIEHVINLVDLILVMSVIPAPAANPFPTCSTRCVTATMVGGRPIDIEIDGGITPESRPRPRAPAPMPLSPAPPCQGPHAGVRIAPISRRSAMPRPWRGASCLAGLSRYLGRSTCPIVCRRRARPRSFRRSASSALRDTIGYVAPPAVGLRRATRYRRSCRLFP